MKKGDKGKKVLGVIVILAIIVSVFGGVVSAEDVSGGLKQSVDDAEIQTAVGNLNSEELTKALDDDPLHQLPATSGKLSYFCPDCCPTSAWGEPLGVSCEGDDAARYWFVAMRWPYYDPCTGFLDMNAKSWWHNKKVLVTNPANGKQVVLAVKDWGPCNACIPNCPQSAQERVVDVSKTALDALDTVTDDTVNIEFADQSAELGVVSSASAVKNLDVPYIHQCWDTPNDFDGRGACSATSAMMAVAYYGILDPWPCDCSQPYPHTSDWGNYISKIYTYNSHTFDDVSNDYSGTPAYGAYGYIYHPGSIKEDMRDYFILHGIDSEIDDSPTEAEVKAEIDAGYPVVAVTWLTVPEGHWILIKGYTDDGQYIVNDPYGSKPYGSGICGNYNGADVQYTWGQVGDRKLVYVRGANQPPIASAADISNQPDVMYPDTLYEVTAKYYDPDGRANLGLCTLILSHHTIMMGWGEDLKVPVETSEFINDGDLAVDYTQITDSYEGYQLTWKFKLNDRLPEAENCIDFCVLARDDDSLQSGLLPDCDNTDASFVVIVPTCDGTATSCGIYPNCENCNEDDGCHPYDNGCEERNYYCVSNEAGCDYTPSNRHTDYYDDWDYYCDGDTVRKHRLFHDYYCDGGTCTDHPSMEDDQLVENCNDHDGWYCNGNTREYRNFYCSGTSCTDTVTSSDNCNDYDCWVDTGNTRWIDVNECQEKEQKEQVYWDYACSNGVCTHSVTDTQWLDTGNTQNKPDGTDCDCTASNTLKKCYSGVCTDTGICDATTCGADAACDGKVPGDSCGANKKCDSNCKCVGQAVGEDYGIFSAPLWFVDNNGDHIADDVFGYGFAGATPLVGDINQDGTDDIAVFSAPLWFVDTNGDHLADDVFGYGFAGATSLVGNFG